MFGIVAFLAVQCGMNPFSLKTSLAVVKCIFIEINQAEFTAMVFVVAGITILTHHIDRTMVTFSCSLIVADYRMTSQTIVVCHFIAD